MSTTFLPIGIRKNWIIKEYRHAGTILRYEFPNEYFDVVHLLTSFVLKRSDILKKGGRKSPIAEAMDSFLYARGWKEHKFDTIMSIDSDSFEFPTHKIDCLKNRIALDIEWNNKDPFFDRDLNNFRLLHERNAISLAIIITRDTNLQSLFSSLGKGKSYGSSTTHMNKLVPRIDGGSGGGCPILVFGITENVYNSSL